MILLNNILNALIMAYIMPLLPYPNNGLEPIISAATIDYHYGKHLQTYVNNLNALVPGTEFENKDIEYVVKEAPEGPIFNNAGQVINHTLYFMQLTPAPENKEPYGKLKEQIEKNFGSFENMKKLLSEAAITLFGSGWAWLSKDREGNLQIGKYYNGDNPLRHGLTPLLGIDVWEHSYYLDYQNRRADHVNRIREIINWKVINDRFI